VAGCCERGEEPSGSGAKEFLSNQKQANLPMFVWVSLNILPSSSFTNTLQLDGVQRMQGDERCNYIHNTKHK
jgi:hypothetical protein